MQLRLAVPIAETVEIVDGEPFTQREPNLNGAVCMWGCEEDLGDSMVLIAEISEEELAKIPDSWIVGTAEFTRVEERNPRG
jgi:hypothetical protein